MRAYNSRKTPREIYLFRKKGQKIALTKRKFNLTFDDGVIKRNIHSTFKLTRKDKIELLKCRFSEKFAFEKQLWKILYNKPKLMSISSMIACFKGINDSGRCTIDFSKVQRKYFVSRNLFEIAELLKEKGILKEKGVEN
ncbi:hypothetical protein I6E36_13170 [Fusobacterium mortiferum]|jgi:hypothetical protein|uniref:hypothetical protein n=1 Tax=Fusobacterium mortiferum TaxID=850 RepID=UPI001F2E2C56|nr:hypothetical protein [Fusobacterium mortiferum]MCF2629027.1 hypothetical protein [Fusobacterium mortiferum]